MNKLSCAIVSAAIILAGCSDNTKDVSKTETSHTNADGKTVKTETTVEKKTSVDK